MAIGAAALAGVGLLSLVLFALQVAEPLAVMGAGLLIAGAAAMAGGALGFLFGIPRMVGSAANAPAAERQPYAANTNLEQISDWLTKILVGAGLTQLGSISSGVRDLTASLAPALGGQPASSTMAGALLVEFVILGFLGAWLLTRLLLVGAFLEADKQQALDNFAEAEYLSDLGEVEHATELRAKARGLLGLSEVYDDVRRRLPASESRTAQMQALVDAAKSAAGATTLTQEQVRELFNGKDGERIYALAVMQGARHLADYACLLDAVGNSRSAFEQYQGLVLAELVVSTLSDLERARLLSVLMAEMTDGGRLARSVSRRRIAERLIAQMNQPA